MCVIYYPEKLSQLTFSQTVWMLLSSTVILTCENEYSTNLTSFQFIISETELFLINYLTICSAFCESPTPAFWLFSPVASGQLTVPHHHYYYSQNSPITRSTNSVPLNTNLALLLSAPAMAILLSISVNLPVHGTSWVESYNICPVVWFHSAHPWGSYTVQHESVQSG